MLMSFKPVWPLRYAESFKDPWDLKMNDSDLEHLLSFCPEVREREQYCYSFKNYTIAISNIYNALFTSLPSYVCPDMQFYYIERFMCNISVVFFSGGKT